MIAKTPTKGAMLGFYGRQVGKKSEVFVQNAAAAGITTPTRQRSRTAKKRASDTISPRSFHSLTHSLTRLSTQLFDWCCCCFKVDDGLMNTPRVATSDLATLTCARRNIRSANPLLAQLPEPRQSGEKINYPSCLPAAGGLTVQVKVAANGFTL